MTEKTLEELQAWHQRLVHDVQRVKALDQNGLTRNSPLVRNLMTVEEQIRQKKKNGTA